MTKYLNYGGRGFNGSGDVEEEKKSIVIENLEKADQQEETCNHPVQPTEALKLFFDRIPLFSIPGIRNEGVVELASDDTMGDAIIRLYKENVMGAPVRDALQPETVPLADRYIGLVDFTGLVLWALQEMEVEEAEAQVTGLLVKDEETHQYARDTDNADLRRLADQTIQANTSSLVAESGGSEDSQQTKGILKALGGRLGKKDDKSKREQQEQGTKQDLEAMGFFGLLNQLDRVRCAKVETLAKSFRWGAFLPVHPEDSLLHALLLLSKHKLKAVPLVDVDSPKVTAFITQAAAVQLLLQLAGLSWFDAIAEKPLSAYRFQADQNAGKIISVFGDDKLSSALECLWKNRINSVPVIDRETNQLRGNVRSIDVSLILDQADLFNKRRSITVEEFLKVDSSRLEGLPSQPYNEVEDQLATSIAVATLSVASLAMSKMSEPVTSKPEDSLKDTMEKLIIARSERGYLVDDKKQVLGVITLRDIISLFTPPLAEAPGQWAGFFESALQQSGTAVESGHLVAAN